MRRRYVLILASVIGFANAYCAFQLASLLLCLLPIWAFLLGYFFSRKTESWGLFLNIGYILYIGYLVGVFLTTTGFYMWGLFWDFCFGGLTLCVIGYAAPAVKRVKSFKAAFKAAGVLFVLVLSILYFGFTSAPRYSYSYTVIIGSQQSFDHLELYLPVGVIEGEPYMEIFNHPEYTGLPTGLPPKGSKSDIDIEKYSLQVINTDHGKMLKLSITELPRNKWGPHQYYGKIHFSLEGLIPIMSRESLQFSPEYNDKRVESVFFEEFSRVSVEHFSIPVKVDSPKEAEVSLTVHLYSRNHMGCMLTDFESKFENYRGELEIVTLPENEWIFADVEARTSTDMPYIFRIEVQNWFRPPD